MSTQAYESNSSGTDRVQEQFSPPRRTAQELDEWILSIGGRELTKAESEEWSKKTRWAEVPGESAPF
jgi:hypothetical protein